jgi:Flp pilus assembly protein TadG
MPLVAVVCPALLAFAALSVDVGALFDAKAELQRCADAAALAGAGALIDERRLRNDGGMNLEIDFAVRDAAQEYVQRNRVLGASPTVQLNTSNSIGGDIVLGTLSDLSNYHEPLSVGSPDKFNSVRVHVRRDNERNGPVGLFFARLFGRYTANVQATATATIEDGVVGYAVPPNSGTAQLLPFAVHVDVWNALLAGATPIGDQYAYDPDTGQVESGSDTILEINMYPGGGIDQLMPGNFGTVDIGGSNNSASDIERQIREGISAEDFAYHGGELKLGDDGTLTLTGDTGLSAGFKEALEDIIGLPRAIPLFTSVSGPGDNAEFVIVGFAGIRIMDVWLTGAPEHKHVIVQPSYVIDGTVIIEPESTSSYMVYHTPRLTR